MLTPQQQSELVAQLKSTYRLLGYALEIHDWHHALSMSQEIAKLSAALGVNEQEGQ